MTVPSGFTTKQRNQFCFISFLGALFVTFFCRVLVLVPGCVGRNMTHYAVDIKGGVKWDKFKSFSVLTDIGEGVSLVKGQEAKERLFV